MQLRLRVTYLLKTLKYLEIILNINPSAGDKCRILIGLCKQVFMNCPVVFHDQENWTKLMLVLCSNHFYISQDISFPDVFGKKVVLKNFLKIARKHLCGSLLLKIRLLHECFAVNFAKFLRNGLFGSQWRWNLQITEVAVTVISFICRRH